MKIPALWQREIDAGTEFGRRVTEGLRTAKEPRRPRRLRRTGYGDALARIISRETGEQLYAIISAEYEMLRVPVTDWECCNGEVIQTRCDFLLIEGTLCEVWQDECY